VRRLVFAFAITIPVNPNMTFLTVGVLCFIASLHSRRRFSSPRHMMVLHENGATTCGQYGGCTPDESVGKCSTSMTLRSALARERARLATVIVAMLLTIYKDEIWKPLRPSLRTSLTWMRLWMKANRRVCRRVRCGRMRAPRRLPPGFCPAEPSPGIGEQG
jgi:hypothetical protein